MKVKQVEWTLDGRHGYCPHHDDQNWYRFIQCEHCHVLLIACEEGCIYPASLPVKNDTSDHRCPNCDFQVMAMVPACSDEILKAGFQVSDYK